jgi:F0F1-type ATP synthase membrane subunit b/b'
MAEHDNEPLRFLLQAFNYAVFMGLVWYFASAPAVRLIGEDEAKITIA